MTLEIITIILLFFGIFFSILPIFPGTVYMFLVVLVYGIADHFQTLLPWHLAVFAGMMVLSGLIDYGSGLLGARFGGANKTSLLCGLIGLLVGLILLPPFGLFFGLFLGVLVGELAQMKHHLVALKAASFSLVGAVIGVTLNFLLAVAFFVTFLVIIL